MALGKIDLNPPKHKALFRVLPAINITYNNINTSATSQIIDCAQHVQATLGFELTESGAAFDITIIVEISLDGVNFTQLTNGPLSKWIYDDTAVSGGIQRSFTFPIACQKIRVRVVATGTTATNTFTMSNAALYLRS